MKLTVNDTTPAIALLDNDELFIPAYQRPYRWEGEKSKQLFKDVGHYLKSQDYDIFRIVNRNREDRTEYFTGATVTTLGNRGALEIIDGQQRTTTFYLVAFVRYMLIARMLRERIEVGDQRALDVVQKAIDARNLVFTKDSSFDKLTELKSRVDEDDLTFSDFLDETKGMINSLTREHIQDCDWKLKIRYARNRISKDLTAALTQGCSIALNESNFELKVSEGIKFPSESYQTTLESCLSWLSEEIGPQNSTIAVLSKAETLLSNLLDVSCVCNIKANNQQDAYTLFEILNDRSEPLKDLEIAKNLFYKFAFSSIEGDDEVIDALLDKAEGKWSSAFENGNIEDIVYLAGTMSLTSDYELDFKKGQLADLRKAISLRLENIENYGLENVVEDFLEYQKIGKELNEHYTHQHRAQAVINMIFVDSRELNKISLKYFLALKQNKVVALLVIVLRTIRDTELQKQVALSAILFSIKSLGSIDLLDNLKKIAKALNDEDNIKAQIALFKEKINRLDVKNTYSNWNYTKSNHVTILKTALSLYAASNGEKLGYHHVDLRELPNWSNPKEFDLDHIIPKSKFDSIVNVPSERINEGSKINSLGNMMLLGSKINRQKKLDSIEFLVGEVGTPNEELCQYTHSIDIDKTKANKYIEGMRDIIAKYNISSSSDKVSEKLADDIKDFNLNLIQELVVLNS